MMNTDIAAQHAIDHLAKSGIESLSTTERTLVAAWLFAAGVGNGGFLGYFLGHRSDLAADAPEALRTLGAPRLAELATAANAHFGPDGPPRDREARRAVVRQLPEAARLELSELDRRYFDCDEDIDELLERFLEHQSASAR